MALHNPKQVKAELDGVVFFGAGPLLPFLLLFHIATWSSLELKCCISYRQSRCLTRSETTTPPDSQSPPLFPKGISVSRVVETCFAMDIYGLEMHLGT
jgi:hypothetical protein